MLHAKTQTFIQSAQEEASVISFGITITYPLDKDYIQTWSALRTRIQDILHRLYHLPIYCLLLSIEIHKEKSHKKSDKEKKRRPMHQSRLKGRPHLHLCLMLYNDFLCPSINKLEQILQAPTSLNADLQVIQFPPDDPTKGKFNVKNWFLYCLKESKDSTSQRFLNKYLNFSSSAFLFSGHPDCFDSCSNLANIFNQSKYNLIFLNNFGHFFSNDLTINDNTFFNHLPFVPQTNSDVLKVSHFLNAILKRLKLAIWPGKTHLAKLKLRAKATWEEDLQLSHLYTIILQKVPIKAQELLINSRPFNLYLRDYQKLDFNWLPQVTILSYLIELSDGIYNLRTGTFTPHSHTTDSQVGLVSCSTFWPDLTFQNLHWPDTFLKIMARLRFERNF
jgi:hypothetical protein